MQHGAEQLHSQTQAHLGKIFEALESGTFQPIQRMLNGLRPAQIAHLLESSPPKSRLVIWQLIDQDLAGEVLQELSEDLQLQILEQMDSETVAEVTETLDDDDVTDILQHLPNSVIQQVLAAMTAQNRERVESLLSYDEDTAGGLMSTDIVTVRPRVTLDVVLRYLRRHDELPASTDNLFVVNSKGKFLGILSLRKLLTTDPNVTVREIMLTDLEPIAADMPSNEVAHLFEHNDWVSCPVVDEDRKVIGRITIDDVVDVIREDADHSLMGLAGLNAEEATFAPLFTTTKRRAIWLGINLITAAIASYTVYLFSDAIQEHVAFAILMPLVPSMGGVAGNQTITLIIRGMAMGQIGRNNINWLFSREFLVGAINGVLWAIAAGFIAWLISDIAVAFIMGAAMIISLITAACTATMLPLVLKRLTIDPALAGGVLITTVTDVVGIGSFLGLATFFYF